MVVTAEPRGAVSLHEPVERGQPGRRLHLAVATGVLAQDAHQLVDLADGLASDLLDRLEGLAGGLGVVLGPEAAHAGVHQDHVHRVARRVVQIAGDPPALLGRGEPALALGLALGAQRPLLELRHPLAPQAAPIAGEPDAAPDEDAEQGLRGGERVPFQPVRRHVRCEQRGGERQREASAGT